MSELERSTALRALGVALGLVVVGVVVVLARAGGGDNGDGPDGAALRWVRAAVAGDCDRLFDAATPTSRAFFDAIGGCPLEGPVDAHVGPAVVREERSDAAVVVVDADGATFDEPLEIPVVREPAGPWLVEMTAARACASLADAPPQPGDCEPLTLEGLAPDTADSP